LLGAQHCHFEDKGAFTGEVSPAFLSKLGVKYVICGHSERREIFAETDEMVQKKVSAVITNKMTPILCVGETLDEREADQTLNKVLGQLRSGLSKVTPEQAAQVVIAYEPIWAIGTGDTCEPQEANYVIGVIRSQLDNQNVPIQYGGSVKPDNIDAIMSQPEIDGALVGGGSLDPVAFARIVNYR
jgi:triosephosphate isomerase